MTTQRDELAREIYIADNYGQTREASIKDWEALRQICPGGETSIHKVAEHLIAAGYTRPREITTVEELRGLGRGSVVHCIGDLTGEDDGDQTLICTIAPNRVSHLIWQNHSMRITTPALFQSYETITVLHEGAGA